MKKLFLIMFLLIGMFLYGCKETYIKIKAIDVIEVGERVELIIESSKNNPELIWSSSNENIAKVENGFIQGISEGKVIITAKLAENEKISSEINVEVIVPEKVIETMDNTKRYLDNFVESEVNKWAFIPYSKELNINESIVYPNTVTKLRPGSGTTGVKMNGGVKFIVIHDTGMPSPIHDAAGINQYIHEQANSETGRVASWHFTVGEDGIYQHIPDDEIGWHAGDGVRSWELNDTNIKADDPSNLDVTIIDGYWAIAGIKSELKVDLINGRIPTTGDLVDSGIICEVGENGNYFIGSTYYNDEYRKIANTGGGSNGIGIETCINQGNNYQHVLIKTAKLVAYLLNKHNLTISAVKQHNNFSGKGCPAIIRSTAGRWDEFLKHVEFQLALYKESQEVKFSFEIDNETIIDKYGNVNQNLINDVVVNLTFHLSVGGVSEDYYYQITAKGMTIDQKLVAVYNELYQNIPKQTSNNIILPTFNQDYQASILWTSSHPELMSSSGEYHQPENTLYVTLTAQISIKDKSIQKIFKVRLD